MTEPPRGFTGTGTYDDPYTPHEPEYSEELSKSMTEPLDLDAIEARTEHGVQTSIYGDDFTSEVIALIAEVRRLRANYEELVYELELLRRYMAPVIASDPQ